MDTTLAVLAGLTPSVGVGLLFWFAMRKILRADRHEREALERMDREGMWRQQKTRRIPLRADPRGRGYPWWPSGSKSTQFNCAG